jgi:hypothetical protein
MHCSSSMLDGVELKENCNTLFQLLRVKAIGKDDGRSRQRFGVPIDEKRNPALASWKCRSSRKNSGQVCRQM